jgi:RNA polymerase sigma-70 factor (ECF subfamily)
VSAFDARHALHAVASGDVAALSALYDEYSAVLMGVVLAVVKNRAEAEEVLQDCFLTIWKKAGMYQAHLGKPLSWMVTIAKHKSYDRYRRLVKKSEAHASLMADERDVTNHPQPSDFNDGRENLEQEMDKLSDDQKEAIELVFYQGYTQQEVARKLSTPLGTVKARIRRGLLQMQQSLLSKKK